MGEDYAYGNVGHVSMCAIETALADTAMRGWSKEGDRMWDERARRSTVCEYSGKVLGINEVREQKLQKVSERPELSNGEL